jgi:hypothetical protein
MSWVDVFLIVGAVYAGQALANSTYPCLRAGFLWVAAAILSIAAGVVIWWQGD